MLNAEELGVSSKNVDEALKSDQPEIRRLLGVEGNFGEQLGLTKDWVVRIVKHVGNYGEVFERNVGTGLQARDQPRHQPALDQGRHPVRAADPVNRSDLASESGHRAVRPMPRHCGRLNCERHVLQSRDRRCRAVGCMRPGMMAMTAWTMQVGARRSLAAGRLLQQPEDSAPSVYQLVLLAAVLWFGFDSRSTPAPISTRRTSRPASASSTNTAGFGINQTLIPYNESDTYGRVFLVGLLNTLLVAGLGIVLATVLGFVIGIARLSPNWLLARLAGGYVELIRNLPLLFQILFWYLAVLGTLPGPRQSISLVRRIFLSTIAGSIRCRAPGSARRDGGRRGLLHCGHLPRSACGSARVIAVLRRGWAQAPARIAPARRFRCSGPALALLIGLPLVVLARDSAFRSASRRPSCAASISSAASGVIPEFVALLLALTIYTAAFIAEIVRAGILAVPTRPDRGGHGARPAARD